MRDWVTCVKIKKDFNDQAQELKKYDWETQVEFAPSP